MLALTPANTVTSRKFELCLEWLLHQEVVIRHYCRALHVRRTEYERRTRVLTAITLRITGRRETAFL